MAYKVLWIVENHVVYVGLSKDVRLEDFRESSKEIADLLEVAYADGAANIIGIIDLTDARLGALMRSAVSIAQDISSVIDPRHWEAKPGFVVLITQSEAAKVLTAVIIRISKQPMTTVGTLGEALTVVCSMYPELQAQIDAYQSDDGHSTEKAK